MIDGNINIESMLILEQPLRSISSVEDILCGGEEGVCGWGLSCQLHQQNRQMQLNPIYRSLKIHTHKAKIHTLQEHIQAK